MSGWTGHFPNLEVMLAAEEHARKRVPKLDLPETAKADVISDRDDFVARFTTEQLVAIVCGHVDLVALAHEELKARGVSA